MTARKNVVLLGATGSIGQNTLQVLRHNPDRLQLIGAAANTDGRQLGAIAREFDVPHVALADEKAFENWRRQPDAFPADAELHGGLEGVCALASIPDADIVLVAAAGTGALRPTLAAIEAGKNIALANKEILVLAGPLVIAAAARKNVRLLPVDSEHNALFQCLEGHRSQDVARLILTASGGPFLDYPEEALQHVTPADALRHPNWSMGPKVTVDSATMANKGLEIIEACRLFDVDAGRIDVVIHRQSIVHSIVEMIDGSMLAQLSPPSMTFPIQHALLYPERGPRPRPSLDFSRNLRLDLEPVREARYPCLRLARNALVAGGTAPAVFNTANEVAVTAFLEKTLAFQDIPRVIENTLELSAAEPEPRDLESVLKLEETVRRTASEITHSITWKTIS